jgi:hypothetical protein
MSSVPWAIRFKPILPKVIWRLARRVYYRCFLRFLKKEEINYQFVKQEKFLHEMHSGKFSDIHEKYSLLDTHIRKNVNVTRLRVYTLCTWAQVALTNTNRGDFLSAGISFGTSSLVVSEFLKLENYDRRQFFIDPMDGRGRSDYNSDRSLVESRWNPKVELIWIQEPLNIQSIDKVGEISFAHLNTGAWDAEVGCLSTVYRKLVPGGILVMDYYGWKPREMQLVVNNILDDLGGKYFITPSLQLVIIRQ